MTWQTCFEIFCELEFKADRARFASKLGVTSDVLEPPHAPRDMTVENYRNFSS